MNAIKPIGDATGGFPAKSNTHLHSGQLKVNKVMAPNPSAHVQNSQNSNASNENPLRRMSEIQGMIQDLNSQVNYVRESLHFRVHESSGQLVVEVQDMATGEIIRAIPPEQLLDSLGKIREAVGALVDAEV